MRAKSAIPKRHFKFYYTSSINSIESYVLLDTLEEKHTYPVVEARPIEHPLFETDENTVVVTPSVESILGDKLTLFAPNTVGIPYGAGKSMEIVKQLFDIGELFAHCADMKTIMVSYTATQALESGYRTSKPSREASLDDTIDTSFMMTQYLLKGSESNDHLTEIAAGLKQIENHLMGVTFTIVDARLAASKAALLAAIIRTGRAVLLSEYPYEISKKSDLKTVDLPGQYKILNRLKK